MSGPNSLSVCPRCGSTETGSLFCKKCGNTLRSVAPLILSVRPDFERLGRFWGFSKTIAIVLIIAATALIVFFGQIYIVSNHAGVTVFSKGNEAYVFLGTSSTGYHFRYLQYPAAAIGGYFYAPPIPANDRVSTMVIRITPSGIQRFQLEYGKEPALAPSFLTPYGDSFYAMCPGMILCKLSGTEFSPATQQEQQALGGLSNLVRGDINNRVINGWFVRETRAVPGDHFEIHFGSGFVISAKNRATDMRDEPSISVVLVRPNEPTEVSYDVDGSPRRVSRAEYWKTFGRS